MTWFEVALHIEYTPAAPAGGHLKFAPGFVSAACSALALVAPGFDLDY